MRARFSGRGFARTRFLLQRRLGDRALAIAVALSFHNRILARWKNRIADRMVMVCVLGGAFELLDVPEYPVTILARVGKDVERLELYACDPAGRVSGYHRRDFHLLADVPAVALFGGGIHMFMTPDDSGAKHYFVRAYTANGHRDSDIVISKIDTQPTERRDGILRVEGARAPVFRWPVFARHDLWVSSLMLLRGPERDLTTGVYSWDQQWTFPDLSRAPFFYHEAEPEPTIVPGVAYEAVYLAIDQDRWVAYLDTVALPPLAEAGRARPAPSDRLGEPGLEAAGGN